MRVLLKLALSLCVFIAICIAILSSGVGSKKIHFIAHGNLTFNSTRTPATLVGVFDLYAPYIWWAKNRGYVRTSLWEGDEYRLGSLNKIVPSGSDEMIWLETTDGKRSGAYIPGRNNILLKFSLDSDGHYFEGECKPFQPLFQLE